MGIMAGETVAFDNGCMNVGFTGSRAGMTLFAQETARSFEFESTGGTGMRHPGGDVTDPAVPYGRGTMDKFMISDGGMTNGCNTGCGGTD